MIRKLKKCKIKKGDNVVVLLGKDKNKQGKVLNVDYKKGKVTVSGINLVKKTVRPSPQYPKGGIIEIEAPIDVSNVMVVCPKCNKRTRQTKKILPNGRKVRACNKCGEILDKV
jgi:large subunit ribosomal protein L24